MSTVWIAPGRGIDRDELLAMEVTKPRPGQQTTTVRARRPYHDKATSIQVDTNKLQAALRHAAALKKQGGVR